jgi:hypothetical protein
MTIIVLVVALGQYLNETLNLGLSILTNLVLPIAMLGVNLISTNIFSKKIERVFISNSIEVQELKMKKILTFTAIPIFVFSVGVIISVITYLIYIGWP